VRFRAQRCQSDERVAHVPFAPVQRRVPGAGLWRGMVLAELIAGPLPAGKERVGVGEDRRCAGGARLCAP
jgi:hypothetical protein